MLQCGTQKNYAFKDSISAGQISATRGLMSLADNYTYKHVHVHTQHNSMPILALNILAVIS